MEKSIYLRFDSSVENIENINESFASATLRVCYTGPNPNGSCISKEAIERAIPTMYNCPVVCNYDIESDSIGGHDMSVVTTDSGDMRLVNLTDAIGVVPMSAQSWWEDYNGHEYFNTEVILWKRSPAFSKIESDGCTAHSMEIRTLSGRMSDGLFYIDQFEFNAFCLLGDGVRPCFADSELQMFDMSRTSLQFSEMMHEYKSAFQSMQPSQEVAIHNQNTEGGLMDLDEKLNLAAEYNIDVDSLEFSLEDYSVEELKEKFEAMQAQPEAVADDVDQEPEVEPEIDFALDSQFREELFRSLESEMVDTCFGQIPRYSYFDHDCMASEVYAYDFNDWNLYGFAFAVDGDNVIIDFESKKRMKLAVVEYDDGEQVSPFGAMFAKVSQCHMDEISVLTQGAQEAANQISEMESELNELREFKMNAENEAMEFARNELFAKFEDLVGIEAFDELRADCDQYSIDELEEKCYAIRGRNAKVAKFSVEPKSTKLLIEDTQENDDEPYGGLFATYGVDK